MKIVLISGDGAGAGKTYASRLFGQATWTLADGIRGELQQRYPGYNWYNRTQEYKNSVIVPEWRDGYATVRQVLLEYGQEKCAVDPRYWVDRLIAKLKSHEELVQGVSTIAIDDIRKLCELEQFRLNFKDVVHIHIENPEATHEPEFDASSLKRVADYVVKWKR